MGRVDRGARGCQIAKGEARRYDEWLLLGMVNGSVLRMRVLMLLVVIAAAVG